MDRVVFSAFLAFAGAVMMPLASFGAEEDFVFTYDYEGATHDLFGIQRNVGIDAAMFLNDPALVGSEILGISVDIPVKEGCACDPVASAWLTRKLQVEGENNLPDLQQVNGEIKNYGTDSEPELRLDLTFPEPYTLTEEGVYVGYSVTVTSCNVPGSGWTAKYPVVTVCDIDRPECFMIHCTKGTSTLPQKYPEWTDLGEGLHQALAMRVMMRGSVTENSASLVPQQTLYVAPGSTGNVYVNLNNHGINPITSIEYSYTIGSEEDGGEAPVSSTRHLTLDPPVKGMTGAYVTLDLPFEAPEAVGDYSVSLSVEKVNGQRNNHAGASVLDMVVVPFLPLNRPLVEDYTGTWCGYCPAVYVTVGQMQDKYGEAFLPIAYHVSDQLQGVATADLPSSTYGLPKVYMGDRSEEIDYANLESLWLHRRRELAPADIEVSLSWTDAAHTALRAESKLKFIYDEPDADYMVTYAMVEDGMSDPTWLQANHFGDKDFTGPYWDLFCGKEYMVSGLVYNDVVVSFPSTEGIEGSLPSSITGGKEYTHSDVLYLKDALCRYPFSANYEDSLIMDTGRLRIVAILIDGKTGNVCNAATTGYAPVSSDPSESVFPDTGAAQPEILATEYISLDGRPLRDLPSTGIVIRVDHLADGTLRTAKITL